MRERNERLFYRDERNSLSCARTISVHTPLKTHTRTAPTPRQRSGILSSWVSSCSRINKAVTWPCQAWSWPSPIHLALVA